MKSMRAFVCAAALAAAATFTGAALAQAMQMPMPAPAAKAMVVDPTDGEVRKVDKEGRKITLKHGEIRNLGMGPMAMQFDVKDRALIDKLKAGDKVKFKAVYEGGKYVVTEIRPAK
jgi:Cu(I)/Ag(I) efflux system protein CusF